MKLMDIIPPRFRTYLKVKLVSVWQPVSSQIPDLTVRDETYTPEKNSIEHFYGVLLLVALKRRQWYVKHLDLSAGIYFLSQFHALMGFLSIAICDRLSMQHIFGILIAFFASKTNNHDNVIDIAMAITNSHGYALFY